MSITHCNAENEVDSSRAMSGSATLTMVTSSSSMKVPTQMDTSGNHFFMTTPPGFDRSDQDHDSPPVSSRDSHSGQVMHNRRIQHRSCEDVLSWTGWIDRSSRHCNWKAARRSVASRRSSGSPSRPSPAVTAACTPRGGCPESRGTSVAVR